MGQRVIEFYTIHCPMCKSIQKMMDLKGIPYQIIDDKEKVLKKADELKIKSAPFALIEEEVYVEKQLKTWIKEYQA